MSATGKIKPIPTCPLMSAGNSITIVCEQEKCAWYVAPLKTCAVYVIAHNALIDVKAKQFAQSKPQQ
jgi:hypothetical protein